MDDSDFTKSCKEVLETANKSKLVTIAKKLKIKIPAKSSEDRIGKNDQKNIFSNLFVSVLFAKTNLTELIFHLN